MSIHGFHFRNGKVLTYSTTSTARRLQTCQTGKWTPSFTLDPLDLTEISRYPLSKPLQVLAVRKIAAKLSETKPEIVINTINPGLVNTELTRNMEGLLKIFMSILKFLVARSPEVASAILVHAATQGPESQGLYFVNCDLKK